MRTISGPYFKPGILFLLLLAVTIPVSAQTQVDGTATCQDLECSKKGQICSYAAANGSVMCVDACKDDLDLALGRVGSCSIDNRFCDADGQTRFRCDVCGCPVGNKCGLDGLCVPVCDDGTESGLCADKAPLYCENGELVENSQICGCEEGRSPQADGTCGFLSEIQEGSPSDFLQGSLTSLDITKRSPQNLALLGTAFASSTYQAPDTWWYQPDPKYVNDQRYTYAPEWASESGTSNDQDQHIGIEWSEPQTFNEVMFIQTQQRAKSFRVQYEKDGKWIDLTNEISLKHYPQDYSALRFNYNLTHIHRAAFDPVTSTKVRIVFSECYYLCRIYEMEVYNSQQSALKLAGGSLSGEYTSRVYDTGITGNNITYAKLRFNYSVDEPVVLRTENVAPEATLEYSSVYNNEVWNNGNNLNTEVRLQDGWVTGWGAYFDFNQWVSFSFPDDKEIGALEISEYTPHVNEFALNTKEGGGWKNVENLRIEYPAQHAKDEFITDYQGRTMYTFEPFNTRDLQLYFKDVRDYPRLHQVKLFERGEGSKKTNIAKEGKAIASDTYPDFSSINVDFVNDGVMTDEGVSRRWSQSEINTDSWVGIEWPRPRTINKITIVHGQARIPCYRYYHIEYWDGDSWEKILRQYNKGTPDSYSMPCIGEEDQGYYRWGMYNTTDIFEPVVTTKIRIRPEPNWWGWAAVQEIEAYEPVRAPENIAEVATVTVSSTGGGQNVDESFLTDGSTTNVLASGETNIAPQASMNAGHCSFNPGHGYWTIVCGVLTNLGAKFSWDYWLTSDPDHLNDGEEEHNPPYNFWVDSPWGVPSSQRWFTADFAEEHTFTKIEFLIRRDRVQSYKLRYWDSASNSWQHRNMPSIAASGAYIWKRVVEPLDPPITTSRIGLSTTSSLAYVYWTEFKAYESPILPKVWQPDPSDATPVITLDLGEERQVTGISFVEEQALAREVVIEKDTGSGWFPVKTFSLTAKKSERDKLTNHEFAEPVAASKLRFRFTDMLPGTLSLREVTVMATPIVEEPDISGNRVKIQMRSAPNVDGEPGPWTPWTGPDGTSGSHFTDQEGQDIPAIHDGNKYTQYRAVVESQDPELLTILDEVEIGFSGKFNRLPIVTGQDYEVILGEPISFSGFAYDIGGHITDYFWDFGNGATAQGKEATHTYSDPGGYDVTLTARDNDGGNASATLKAYVNIYDCLTPDTHGSGPDASLFSLEDPIVERVALEALREYADNNGIRLSDIDTTNEYYEAANEYVTNHLSYRADDSSGQRQGWDMVSAKKTLEESGSRCGNDYCGDCEDFAIATVSLVRAMGVNNKCAYVACSNSHCWNVLNINSKYRLVEPQSSSLKAKLNSQAYEWEQNNQPVYAAKYVVNDHRGQFYSSSDADPASYTLNYPGADGLPDGANRCPASYSAWNGEGDQTYFEDVCA